MLLLGFGWELLNLSGFVAMRFLEVSGGLLVAQFKRAHPKNLFDILDWVPP